MQRLTIGLDIAKSVFHLVVMNHKGKVLRKKKLTRNKLASYFANLQPSIVVMEACGSTNYWAKQFAQLGHEVKAIAPQYVVPFRKGNKTDFNDAQAIAEASQRADMRFVSIKGQTQQDVQMLHRIRESKVKMRTAVINQTRGLLAEYGITMPKQVTSLKRYLPGILEDAENGLSDMARAMFHEQMREFCHLNEQVNAIDNQLKSFCKSNDICLQLMTMPGIGPIIATLFYASIGNGKAFKSGRHLSAWIGIVPKQNSTGDKANLLGISKRGNAYIRTQLINGARAAINHVDGKDDRVSQWASKLKASLPYNKAVVALANKMARMIWAMLNSGQDYQPGKVSL